MARKSAKWHDRQLQKSNTRKFGGKEYVLKGRQTTKAGAKQVALKIRRMGQHRARVAPVRGQYGVFLRDIGYRGP